MPDINDLLAALDKVASAYNGGSDDDDERDNINPDEEDPDKDDRDVHDEEGEDGEEDDDFSKPKLMKAVMLLQKVEAQAERELDRKEQEWKRQAAMVDQALSMMSHLRNKTADIHVELEMRRRLKAEQERYHQAAAELREANLTAEERRLRAEEIRRGQILFSRIVPENHPDWRSQENYNAEYYRQQRSPTGKTKS